MLVRQEAVEALLDQGPAMLVRVESAKGSTPREAGAWMLVSEKRTLGTIGGGQLEYIATDAARALLARGGVRQSLDVPLGPEIGQCCGGRTGLTVERAEGAALERLLAAGREGAGGAALGLRPRRRPRGPGAGGGAGAAAGAGDPRRRAGGGALRWRRRGSSGC